MTDRSLSTGAEESIEAEANTETAEGLSGPGAGLGATGTTADQMRPGQREAGTTYGDPGGEATASEELAEGAARAAADDAGRDDGGIGAEQT